MWKFDRLATLPMSTKHSKWSFNNTFIDMLIFLLYFFEPLSKAANTPPNALLSSPRAIQQNLLPFLDSESSGVIATVCFH